MKRISKRMLSSLLALIMVFSVMAMPALGAEEEVTETVVRPTPIAYEWDFDGSALNTEHAKYSNGLITGLPYIGSDIKNIINGGTYDSYFQAGYSGGGNCSSAIEIVQEDDGEGNMLRFSAATVTASSYPYVKVQFPNAIDGVVDIEFNARIRKHNSTTDTFSPFNGARTRLFSLNGAASSPYMVWFGTASSYKTNVAAGNSFGNNTSCNICGSSNKTNYAVTNIDSGELKTFKIRADYTGATAYTNVYKNGTDLIRCSDHVKQFATTGTELNAVYFMLAELTSTTLAEGETVVMDIDNIKVTPVPAAPSANITDGAYGVDVYKNDFAVDFNATVAETDKDAVKIVDANGNEVATTNTVIGTKVNVAPNTSLAPQSAYKLIIPKTEVMGTTYDAQEIGFYTAKDYALGSMNFNSTLAGGNAVMDEVTKEFAGKVTAEADSVGTVGKVGAENGVLYLQTSTAGTLVAGSYLNLNLAEAADELFHAEFVMDMSKETANGYATPVDFYSGNVSIGRLRAASKSLLFYDGTKYNSLVASDQLVGDLKYIVDIDTTTGKSTCKVVNPASGVEVGNCTFTITAAPVTKVRFTAYADGTNKYTDTQVIDGTTHYINRVEFDDILIADMPIPEAKFATPTVGVEAGDTPEIEFNYPIEDASKLELYVGETKVEDAVFTLSPDGYTVTVDADFAEDTEYTVKLDAVTTMGGGALSGSIGFLTAPKAPQFTIDANVYAKADTEFATPLAGLTADEEVAVVVDVTNNENTVAFDTIVYVGVYTEGGNLLIATATEENFKPGTAELTSSFKVPANAHHIKVFAWDKYLTPYCVPTELFNN